MADFRKVFDADNQIVWVNRDLVNAVVYLKEEKKTVFCFGGGPDNYVEIPGACPIFSDRGGLTMATEKSFGCRFANTEKCADSCFKCELFHRDYISREAAINELREDANCDACWAELTAPRNCKSCPVQSRVERIEKILAADVEPVVHGHWVYEEPNSANSFKGAYWCDQCHQPEPYRRKFCPNCGADMRE